MHFAFLSPLALVWGPFAWSMATLIVAIVSLIACVVLLVLSKTKWGRSRPTHRYAAISLAAHLLLLCVASSVRYGVKTHGDQEAPPMRVRIVMRDYSPPVTEPTEEEEEAVEETVPAAPAIEETAEELTPPQSEQITPAVESQQTEEVADALPETPAELTAPDLLPSEATSTADSPPVEAQSVATEPTPQMTPEIAAAPEPQPVVEPIPFPIAPVEPIYESPPEPETAYMSRGDRRGRTLEEEGGDEQTEAAVAAGLRWLVHAQRHDGAWDARRWGAGKERRVLEHDRGGAGSRAETGLTGLALLALLGDGHTHLEGPYRDTVAAGLEYLIRSQARDGDLGGQAKLYARTYCHSMATFALAEALATTDDERLRPSVEDATSYLLRTQNRTTGGWRYRPGDRGDMSQMGWVVMALRSAELGGIAIRPEAWRGIERFLQSVEKGKLGGLASYQDTSPVTPTMTAEALYCRQILGISNSRRGAAREAAAYLGATPPTDRPANFYYWYYATLALHHNRHESHNAREAWRDWNERLKQTLLPLQVTSGQNAGSWTPNSLWGGYGGRVYTTALSTMCLEVYYRYDEDLLGRDPWLATRGSDAYRR